MARLAITSGLAAALAALAFAAPASADIRTFKVTAEGSGSYHRYDDSRGQFGLGFEEDVAADFSWRVVFPRLMVDSVGGVFAETAAPPEGTITGEGESYFMNHGESGGQPVKTPGSCTARGSTVRAQGGRFLRDAGAPAGGEQGAHLVFRPFDEVRIPADCDGALVNLPHLSIWDGREPEDAFDTSFFLPKEATDQGKIIQLLEQTPAQKAACTLRQPWTQRCTLDWSGTLTFELIEVMRVDPDEPIDPDDLILPLEPDPKPSVKPRRGKLAPNGSKASVEITCPAGCSGTVRAYAAGSRAAARRPRPLATRRFQAGAGSPAKVTLKFRGAAKRAVRRAGAVRLVVSAGGETRTLIARAGR